MKFKYCLQADENQFILQANHSLSDREIKDWAKINKINHVQTITNIVTMMEMNKRDMASAIYEDSMMAKKIVWSIENNEMYGKLGGFAIFKIVLNKNGMYDRFRVSCVHEIFYDVDGIFWPGNLVSIQDCVEENIFFEKGEINDLIQTLSRYDTEIDETIYWKTYQLWKDKTIEQKHDQDVQQEINKMKARQS